MDVRKEEYRKVLEKFPDVISVGGDNYLLHFVINNEILLEVDFRKYPKKMKAYLINNNKEYKFKLSRAVYSLRNWSKHSVISVLEIIDEILLLIDNLKFNQIMIKKDFLEGLVAMCKQNHPRKMRGVLGVHKGIVSEYILPSRACTDSEKNFEIFKTTCNLPLDLSYEGTFISRPSGMLSTNEKLNQIFKKRRFTMLLAHPYNLSDSIKCFDTSGQILEHIIID
ncbi:MAG: hypothetical protein E3J90_00480 [Promethearchaeota archaeon]|nr:MAG: hypothetical protein E3J90_00480 [Candidatus Lokiarchaeota archaeon]